MNIDSNVLETTANTLLQYQSYYSFQKISLQNRHNQIQSKLSNLSTYLSQSASLLNSTENNIKTSYKKGSVTNTHYANWNLLAQLTKRSTTTYLSRTIQVNYARTSANFSSKYFSAGGSFNLGDATLTGSCSASLWKDKKFDPKVTLKSELDVSLVSANAHAKLGGSKIYAYGSAKGYAGVIYAKAQAVLTKDEQTIEAGVGVAALKGSCSISFHLFGAAVTLTGYGSIGSAEANVSYSHKNREWEFGSKLGFICGLGYKVRFSY